MRCCKCWEPIELVHVKNKETKMWANHWECKACGKTEPKHEVGDWQVPAHVDMKPKINDNTWVNLNDIGDDPFKKLDDEIKRLERVLGILNGANSESNKDKEESLAKD